MQHSMKLTHAKGETEFQWYADQFSRALYLHNYSEPQQLNDAVLRLCFQCKIQPRTATVSGLERIVLDLFVRYETSGGFSPVGFFTANGARTEIGSPQYEALGFTGKALRGHFEKLEKAGLIEVRRGTYDPTRNKGYSTKARATPELIDALKAFGVCLENIRCRRINPVVYTNEQGDNIRLEPAYAETAGAEVLDQYNDLLQLADIRVGGSLLLPQEKQLRRIFKDKEAMKDGRHYGAIWQVLPSKARSRITINGNTVSECDIRSTHPLIAYALSGKDLTELKQQGFDPYRLKQLNHSDSIRELVKASVLMMFNCNSSLMVKKAIQGKVNKSTELHQIYKELKDKGIGINDIVGWIGSNNQSIRKFFFSGSWDVFNYHESNIAQRVIEHFTEKGVPVLTVYDSFIIQDSYKDELQDVLTASIALELMMIFMLPNELVSWSISNNAYTDSMAVDELLEARMYRDKFS